MKRWCTWYALEHTLPSKSMLVCQMGSWHSLVRYVLTCCDLVLCMCFEAQL
jgi:hypothetical protein